MDDAMTKHRDADVLVNFASLRSAYESTIETMNYPQVRKYRQRRNISSYICDNLGPDFDDLKDIVKIINKMT